MSIEAALTELLSGIASGRRYWGRAENISPAAGAYLVLNRISGSPVYLVPEPSGYTMSRFQVDVYGPTFGAVVAAAAEVRDALSGFRGTVAGTRIAATFIDGQRDLPASDAGDVAHLFRRSTDVLIHHDE